MNLPSTLRPQSFDDLIGPAREAGLGLARLAARCQSERAPLRVLLLGPPGVGKSAVASLLARALGATTPWQFVECRAVNGKEVNLDFVERAALSWRLTSLVPGYRVFQIEEVDKVTHDAQVRLLTLLDEMPPASAVIATSNRTLPEFEERFQRRFKVFPLSGPEPHEIAALLQRRGVAEAAAQMLAVTCAGNVGAALEDADLHVLA